MYVTQRGHRAVHRRPEGSAPAMVAVFVARAVVGAPAPPPAPGAAARRAGGEEPRRTFEQVAVVVAGSVVAPQLTPELLAGDASAAAQLGRAVDRLRSTGTVDSVTVRDDQGAVLWTDAAATGAPLRRGQPTAPPGGTPGGGPATPGGPPAGPPGAPPRARGTA